MQSTNVDFSPSSRALRQPGCRNDGLSLPAVWLPRRPGGAKRLLAKGVDAPKARRAVNWVDISAFSHVAAFSHVIADSIRNPWMPDQVRHDNPCGLVVPPEDALAFAQAVRTLAADPELCERLGAAGFLYAQAHLDKEAVLTKFEAELLDLSLRA